MTNSKMPLAELKTSFEKRADADAMAKLIIEKKLGACAHVSGPIHSTFSWEDAIKTAEEWICTIKTKASLVDALSEFISDHHPYEVPQIIASPIAFASKGYEEWILKTCR
ncbi:MAG: periplasmic divalent cation tolerance protein [Candidatus Marinamargulisbacteria bacterium]|jgi:periplasmic divalent cation tolerance protein